MNVLQKAKLNMQRGIEHHPDAKIPIIETVRAFSTTFNNQKASKAQIKSANGGQNSPRAAFAFTKRASKTEFHNTNLTIAKSLRICADNIDNNPLRDKVNCTNAEMRIIKLTKTTKLLILGNYSIKQIATEKCMVRVTKTSFANFGIFDFDIKLSDINKSEYRIGRLII